MTRDPKLDRIDIALLCHLQRNGRITNIMLADAVGLSPSPCLQRVKRLEAAGYIKGYGAGIDVGKVVDTILVFTQVTLSGHRPEDFPKFESGIQAFPEVLECHLVSGGYDYLLKVAARSVVHYQSIMERILAAGIGIGTYFSYIVIKPSIVDRPPPLRVLIDAEHE